MSRYFTNTPDEMIYAHLTERFGMDVVYHRPEADRITASEFILYGPVQIQPRVANSRYIYQTMAFVHVSSQRKDAFEWDMLEALEELELSVQDVRYEQMELTDRQNVAEVVVFYVTRKWQDTQCGRTRKP